MYAGHIMDFVGVITELLFKEPHPIGDILGLEPNFNETFSGSVMGV